MLPVVRTTQAQRDLAAIFDYLEERSPAAAQRLAAAIEQRCELLSQFPELGRVRDEFGPGFRSLAIERYVLVYRITPDAVEVLRVFHGARDIEAAMKSGNGE